MLFRRGLRPARVWRNALIAGVFVAVAAQAQAPVDVRVALVIGNAAYPGAAALANPANDAAAMSSALKSLGFSVIEIRDASRTQMTEAIARVRETLAGRKGIGMLYYAGHGLQVDWRNYMVPVDARVGSAAEVQQQAVDVEAVIGAFKAAGNRMNIVVLDACRDNPFPAASGKGLAQMDAPPGTFLAYATAPGNVAEDGQGQNGLYTGFLVQELQRPQARIEEIFKRVRLQVRQKSAGRQVPWESTSLEEDFFFDPRGGKSAPRPGSREDDALFALERAAWERIQDAGRPEDFYAFLQLFPAGRFSEQATFRLNRVERPAIVAVRPRDVPEPPPSSPESARGDDRFRAGDRFEFVVRDAISKAVSGSFRHAIRDVKGNAVVVEDGSSPLEVDAMGAVARDVLGQFDPPRVVLPAEYAVGKTWEGRTVWKSGRGDGAFHYKSRIVRREKITVGAGTFDAWVIETKGSHVRPAASITNDVAIRVWAVPHLGLPVAQELVARNTWRIERADRFELSRLELAR